MTGSIEINNSVSFRKLSDGKTTLGCFPKDDCYKIAVNNRKFDIKDPKEMDMLTKFAEDSGCNKYYKSHKKEELEKKFEGKNYTEFEECGMPIWLIIVIVLVVVGIAVAAVMVVKKKSKGGMRSRYRYLFIDLARNKI